MFKRLSLALAMVFLSLAFLAVPARAGGATQGATQISGIGYFAAPEECDDDIKGADFALDMTGDLQGCLHVFVETAECTPAGTYIETGTEVYAGSGAPGDDGGFTTRYRFEAKYHDCPNLMGEIHGRCQHAILEGSGHGDYEGVLGRINFKDDVEAGNFPYKGHLRWQSSPGPG